MLVGFGVAFGLVAAVHWLLLGHLDLEPSKKTIFTMECISVIIVAYKTARRPYSREIHAGAVVLYIGPMLRLVRSVLRATQVPMLLLLGVGASQPGRASILSAVADYATTPGITRVVGIAAVSSKVALVTTTQLFVSGTYTPSQGLDLQFITLLPNEVQLTTLSQLTSEGGGSGFSPSGNFELFISGLRNSLYGYDVPLQILVSHLVFLGAPTPTSLAASNGGLYTDARGSIYSVDTTTGVAALIAADGAYVTGATTLAAGPGGLLYTVGQAVGNEGSCTAGQWCLIGVDPSNGSLVSGFYLDFDASTSVLAVGSDGRFYLATGDGQGYAYSASGSQFDTLSSSAVNPEGLGGNTSLALDGNGYLYMDDAATGIHIFDVGNVSVPEPGAAGMFALGLAMVWTVRRIRDRRRKPGARVASPTRDSTHAIRIV